MPRRTALQTAACAGLLAAAAPILGGCGSDDDAAVQRSTAATTNGRGGDTSGSSSGGPSQQPSSPASPSAKPSSILPDYVASTVVKADLPGDQNGTPDAFLKYPTTPVNAHATPPLSGGSVSALKLVDTAVPPPLDKNQFWQQLNKRAGAELKMTNIITSDYGAKVATTVAGGDLPDLMQMSVNYVPHAPDLLAKDCQDLSEWLSGEAIRQYPGLAALPTISWRNVVFNGGIYGIPYPLGIVGSDVKVRQDIIDKLGLTTKITSGSEFLDLCKDLTSSSDQRWALTTIPQAQAMVNEMVGVPNSYRVDGGKFVNAIQTDEYKQALDICATIWKSGYIYPDSIASPNDFHSWFLGGRSVIMRDGYVNWQLLTTAGVTTSPEFKMGGLILPKWEGGGQAGHDTGTGMFTFTVLKKTTPARVKQLLTLLDWLASPFGTEEYLFINWGVPGRDYTLNGSDPYETQTGVVECQQMNVVCIANPGQALYNPGAVDVTTTHHSYLKQLMTATVPLPTVGLLSDTDLAKGVSLRKPLTNAVTDVVLGRKKLSDWDAVVKSYLSAGGDQINAEYSEAYAAS